MRWVSSSLAVLAASAALMGHARAQEDTPQGNKAPRSALDQAMLDLQAGQYAAACPALRKLVLEDQQPKTLFLLAECEEKAGHVATAASLYDDYLTLYDKLAASDRKAEEQHEELAATRREALEKRIPRVTLRLPGDAPASTRVTRISPDGNGTVALAVGVPLPIDPGEHMVTTEVPGRPPMTRTFTIREGAREEVNLEVAPASSALTQTRRLAPLEPVPSLLPPLDPGTPPRRIVAYTLGGIGVVGVLGGVVTGAITWAQKGPIAQNCRGPICNATGQGAKNTAKVTGIVSTVALPAGLAALGAGVLVYVTEPAPSKFGGAPRGLRMGAIVGPGSLTVEGTW